MFNFLQEWLKSIILGVRFVRPIGDGPLVLQGGVEAVTTAEAQVEDLVAKRRLAA